MQALADSGCQACCMGVRQMNAMGLQKSDPIKPKLALKAANTIGTKILGGVFVEIMVSPRLLPVVRNTPGEIS